MQDGCVAPAVQDGSVAPAVQDGSLAPANFKVHVCTERHLTHNLYVKDCTAAYVQLFMSQK